ncbi:MAG TPA: DUF5996 family protein [Bryobacteraceae bacterium]|nr:DUF5996 family protein [Bryobacteraceae bacterium]
MSDTEAWPALPLEAWQDTYATLHMWTQIVGKIRKTLTPLVNHWWNVTLYVTARGLTTSPIPYGAGTFEIIFDFIDHQLYITSAGPTKRIALAPRSVAAFYREVMGALHSLGIVVQIHASPDEVANPIPFAEDETHKSYDPEFANRFWRALASVDCVFKEFRGRFIGKCSPVHFFWGSFDLAVTRFSGRRAPERPGADGITREAYSHEVISAGFWPGGGQIKGPAFYAYAAPEPEGFKTQVVRPAAAFYHAGMSEFFLMYDEVRRAESPKAMLMEFLQSTYEAGATLGKWDRTALER